MPEKLKDKEIQIITDEILNGVATTPACIKPQLVHLPGIGDAYIIGVKEDGAVTLKIASDGMVEDVPKEDHHILEILVADVNAFKKQNGIRNDFPETLQERLQDLAERIRANKNVFSHEDTVFFNNHSDQVNAILAKLEAESPELKNNPKEGSIVDMFGLKKRRRLYRTGIWLFIISAIISWLAMYGQYVPARH